MRNTNSLRARSTVPCHASLARVALCPYSSTLFHRRYACSSLLCWSSTSGYFIKYVWRRKFLSPSTITIVSWHSRRLTRRLCWIPLPLYNDAAVLARAIREGFEFEYCPVGGAIEFTSPRNGGVGANIDRCIRPNKLDLLFLISHFLDLGAGGRLLFITSLFYLMSRNHEACLT